VPALAAPPLEKKIQELVGRKKPDHGLNSFPSWTGSALLTGYRLRFC
jgi:hypothetical protein